MDIRQKILNLEELCELNTAILLSSKEFSNREISAFCKNETFYFNLCEFTSSFAYWVVYQNPNGKLTDVMPALRAFNDYIESFFKKVYLPEEFSYHSLNTIISEEAFIGIEDVLALNKMQPDFIDLSALARNVFYDVIRRKITNG